MEEKIIKFAHTIFLSLSIGIICFFILLNISPFGVKLVREESETLGPGDRVQSEKKNSEKTYKVLNDLVYFSSEMNYEFAKAIVKVTYKNDSSEQKVYIGYKDQENWHYSTRLISAPGVEQYSWSYIPGKPVLLQREKKYNSLSEFFASPPKDALVGKFELNSDLPNEAKITDYKPSKKKTKIETPLRGRHVFYVYLKNEPFVMDIEKQDLNMYDGADPLEVSIYKEKDLVYDASIDDDGITDKSKKIIPPQVAHIKNPGPEFPESGVYKVVLDLNQDTVIRSISTNLHKIVFEGTVFPIANKDAYPWIIDEDRPTTLYANTFLTSIMTYHPQGVQPITIGDQIVNISKEKEEVATVSAKTMTRIYIPKNDVIVRGYMGYFAFSPDQYFTPSRISTVSIVHPDQLKAVDYVLTDYTPPVQEGEWKMATAEFDLTKAVTDEGKLSWLIKSPGLKESNRSVLIKSIEVTLIKKPMPFVAKLFNINE